MQGGTESRSQEGEELPKLDSAEECPANRRKKTIRIPVAMTSTDTALTLDVLVQGKEYEFIVDTGADVSLIQPYVGDEPTEELSDVVRGITGQALEIEGTRRLEIEIGNQRCTHDFVVAPFPFQRDGIIGLDLQRKLGIFMYITRGEMTLGGQRMPLTDHPPGRRKVKENRPTACERKPRRRESVASEVTRLVERATEETHGKESPLEGERAEEHQDWEAVLPQTIDLEPQALMITRAKIKGPPGRAAPAGWIRAEPVEVPLRGIYVARTVSNVFTSSELVDHEQRRTRKQCTESADSASTGPSANKAVYCTAAQIGEQNKTMLFYI